MKSAIRSLEAGLVAVISVLAVICFLFALGLNFANVALRYGFHAPIYWAEEVMIFTFVWCTFLGLIVGAARGRHLKVDIAYSVLSVDMVRRLDIVVSVVSACVLIFVAWRAWAIVDLVWRLDQRSIVSEVPMYVPYAAVLFGCALSALVLIIRALLGPAQADAEQPIEGSASL